MLVGLEVGDDETGEHEVWDTVGLHVNVGLAVGAEQEALV